MKFVSDIRRDGLLLTVEFDKIKTTRTPFPAVSNAARFIIGACHEEKLVIRGARGRVLAAMAPPLVLTIDDAEQIVERLDRAISKIEVAARRGNFD